MKRMRRRNVVFRGSDVDGPDVGRTGPGGGHLDHFSSGVSWSWNTTAAEYPDGTYSVSAIATNYNAGTYTGMTAAPVTVTVRQSKTWDPGTGIQGGDITTPADDATTVINGQLNCAVSEATDQDSWTVCDPSSGPSGSGGDSAIYNWSATDGTFAAPNSRVTTWTAPPRAGFYTLTCTIND